MKNLSYVSLPLLLLLLLTGCGETASASFPATAIYGATDATHLAFASWQQDVGTPDIRGTWTSFSVLLPQDTVDVSDPEQESLTLSGEISSSQDQTATLSVGGSYLTARHSGDHLNLIGTVSPFGFQPAVLQSIPSSQVENELVTAFSRATVAGKHLKNLQFILKQEPVSQDNEPSTYHRFVLRAQGYIQTLQDLHDQIMGSNHPCETYALLQFRGYSSADESSLFTLSSVDGPQNTPEQNAQAVANASSLGQALQHMQGAWQSLKSVPVPQISGLSYDWQPSQQEETQAVELAQGQLSSLQASLTTDEHTLVNLKQQDQQLRADVQNVVAKYGC